MKRNFDVEFKYSPEYESSPDISETGVEAVKAGEALTRGLDIFTPAQVGMRLIEKRLKREEYLQTIEGREEILEKELQAFGCSEKEAEQIKAALHEMADDEHATLREGGEGNRTWRVEKETDGTLTIKMEIKNDGTEVQEKQETKDEENVTPEELTPPQEIDTNSEDEQVGLTLEQKAQAPIDVGDISHFQQERRDITDEEDPARRASSVLTQQNNSEE